MASPIGKGVLVGTILQVLMVVCGHYVPQVAAMFPIVGTLLGAVAGWVATRGTGGALGSSAGIGAGAGVVSGVLGTLVSVWLGDVPMTTVAIAAASTAVLGAIGGMLGRGQPKRAAA